MSLDGSSLVWERTYDRASVESFLAAAEAERAHLLAEIEAARKRLAGSEERKATAILDGQIRLAGLVQAAHRELEEARRENESAVEAILGAADIEAAGILAAAHREVSYRGLFHSGPAL